MGKTLLLHRLLSSISFVTEAPKTENTAFSAYTAPNKPPKSVPFSTIPTPASTISGHYLG